MSNALAATVHLDAPASNGGVSAYRDWLGIVASVGCAIHCAAMPFVVGLLPLIGLSFLAEPAFHKWMVGICLALALLAFVPGWRRHRRFLPAGTGLCGLVLISVAAFANPYECACPSGSHVAVSGPQAAHHGHECDAAFCATNETTPVARVEEEAHPIHFAARRATWRSAGSAASTALVASASPTTTPRSVETQAAGLMGLMWALMTPLGGAFLVVGHLFNRCMSGRCAAGCCLPPESEPRPA